MFDQHQVERGQQAACFVSLVGAAASIIFVATKVLSRQTHVCCNKNMFVVTKHIFCHDKSMFVTLS